MRARLANWRKRTKRADLVEAAGGVVIVASIARANLTLAGVIGGIMLVFAAQFMGDKSEPDTDDQGDE